MKQKISFSLEVSTIQKIRKHMNFLNKQSFEVYCMSSALDQMIMSLDPLHFMRFELKTHQAEAQRLRELIEIAEHEQKSLYAVIE